MKRGNKDALWAGGLLAALVALATWRDVARARARDNARGEYR